MQIHLALRLMQKRATVSSVCVCKVVSIVESRASYVSRQTEQAVGRRNTNWRRTQRFLPLVLEVE